MIPNPHFSVIEVLSTRPLLLSCTPEQITCAASATKSLIRRRRILLPVTLKKRSKMGLALDTLAGMLSPFHSQVLLQQLCPKLFFWVGESAGSWGQVLLGEKMLQLCGFFESLTINKGQIFRIFNHMFGIFWKGMIQVYIPECGAKGLRLSLKDSWVSLYVRACRETAKGESCHFWRFCKMRRVVL